MKELGYDYIHGADLAPDVNGERADYGEVLLRNRLENALRRINPDLPAATAIDEAIETLRKPQHASLVENNRAFHEMLTNGVPVEIKTEGGRRSERVKLIDFQHSEKMTFSSSTS